MQSPRRLSACRKPRAGSPLHRRIFGRMYGHVLFVRSVRLCGSLPRELTLLVRARSLMSGKPRPRHRFED